MRFHKSYVDLPDGQIHLRDTHPGGVGAPDARPLVLLHQTASSGMMYDRMIQHMEGRRVIAPDTPGFGGSFDPESPPALSDYVRWLVAMLDALGLGRVHLGGHHTGGCIALDMAVRHPDRVASLAVIGPVSLDAEEREVFRGQYSEPFAPDPQGHYLTRTFDMIAKLGPGDDLDLQHRETVAALRAWSARHDAYCAVWDSDQAALWEQVAVPFLVACAPDDVLLDCLKRVTERRPDAGCVMLEGANFEPDLAPAPCAQMFDTFLSGLGAPMRWPAVS